MMAFRLPDESNLPALMCEACNKDNEAISRCQTCDAFICSYCLWMHQRWDILKCHSIRKLAQYPYGKTVEVVEHNGRVSKCSVHPENTISRYCDKCEQLLCPTCCTLYHKSSAHSIIGLTEAEMKLKESILELASKMSRMAVDLGKGAAGMDQSREKVQARYESILEQIFDRAHLEAAKVQEEATRIEDEALILIQELEQIHGERVEALEKAKTKLRKAANQARNMLDEINRLEGKQDCQMILALKQKIASQVAKLAAKQREGAHDGDSFVTFEVSADCGSVGRLVLEDKPKQQPFCRIKSPKTTECGHSPKEFVTFCSFPPLTEPHDTCALPVESSFFNKKTQSPTASLELEDELELESDADKSKLDDRFTCAVSTAKQCQSVSFLGSLETIEENETFEAAGGLVLQDTEKLQLAEQTSCQDADALPLEFPCKGDREGQKATPELKRSQDPADLPNETIPCPEKAWVLKTEFKSIGPDETSFASATYVATFSDSKTIVVDHMQTDLIFFYLKSKSQSRTVPQRLELSGVIKASNAAVNKNNILVILDKQSVKVFNQQRQLLQEFVPRIGRNSTRSCLAVDDNDTIAVGYKYLNEVSLHKLYGSNIRTLPAPMLQNHMCLSTSSQRIIYTNFEKKKLLGISYDGNQLFSVDVTSDAQKSWGPTGVCCDSEGDIYIAVDKEESAGEIQHYSPDAVYLGCVVKDCGSLRGMAYTPHGEIVVAAKHSVQIYHRTHTGDEEVTNQVKN